MVDEIRSDVIRRLAGEFSVIVEDVAVTRYDYMRDYASAVEQKQVQQQEAERAAWKVEEIRQQGLAKQIVTEGDAVAAKLLRAATKASGGALIELRRIEARQEIARMLSTSNQVSYVPSGANLLVTPQR